MKKLLTAVAMLASTVVFADDQMKPKDQMGQTQPTQTQPSQGQPMPSEAGMGKDMDMGMDMHGMKHQFSASMIQDWPAEAKSAAQEAVSKYGNPTEMTANSLVWRDAGEFKKTMISKEAIDHQFPMAHKDVITQVVDYKVPVDKIDDLAKLDGSLTFNRTKGELSASSDSEAHNIAMLNAADSLIKGKLSVTKARASLAKLISSSQGGQPAPKLQIAAVRQPTADADRPATGMGR